MIKIPEGTIVALPLDQLGLEILRDLLQTKEWNTQNYLARAKEEHLGPATRNAIAEALAWLGARVLIAKNPDQSSSGAIFVTRLGHRVAQDGLVVVHAAESVQGCHPAIEAVARPQFLIGQYELGVFAALKAVEIRVRRLGGFPEDTIGVALMNQAFRQGGSLTDGSLPPGEQEGTRALFAGAYGVLRNPSAHREVSYDTVSEAAEAVQTASLLMRILDRVEKRVGTT